ncbi:hypothetical protein PIB30_086961 [Stylosanthes scabra]|uniref:Uncharacterized protein n=1 Tax=Stylosanthes scabra TaxID=79078 RepID=A0ABU6UUF5_9FABA|nr:hypothetical protein [Stylosanthes scabra]
MVKTFITFGNPEYRRVVTIGFSTKLLAFMKVPSKPTNHSKFTGKCRTPRCNGHHLHLACKSKDKTKGTQKDKNWWVMDQPDLNISGSSATRMLDHLFNYGNYYEED